VGPGTEQASPGTTVPPAPSPDERKTESELSEARRQAAAERKRAGAAEARLAELERAQLSEAERTKADLAAAQAALTAEREARRATELKVALLTAAPKVALLPAAYEDALKLINPALIEWDETGTPTAESVDKALKALIKDRPYLLAPTTPPPPAPGPAAFAPQGSASNGTDEVGRTNMAPLYRIF
jgi:hypothetical protein